MENNFENAKSYVERLQSVSPEYFKRDTNNIASALLSYGSKVSNDRTNIETLLIQFRNWARTWDIYSYEMEKGTKPLSKPLSKDEFIKTLLS